MRYTIWGTWLPPLKNIADDMPEQVDLRLFTAAQLKSWLLHGDKYEGLTEVLIDRNRAFALVTNPYVRDDMALVSALFVDGKVAAYTYVFPDRMEKPAGRTIFWNTTLYVNPKYEGRGYAYCVIAAICELYGDDYFDLDAAEASVENLKYQGLTVKYLPQYILRQKATTTKGLKAALARTMGGVRGRIRSKESLLRKELAQSKYRLQYVRFVDDETYAFIKQHSEGDLLLRSQAMFDWILQHPFMIETPVRKRVRRRCRFGSSSAVFGMYGVVVRVDERIVGFVILRSTATEWAVKYIYYAPEAAKEVYLAVAEHLLVNRKQSFFTADKGLLDFVAGYDLFAVSEIYNKSFAYPAGFEYDERLHIQAGDGDNVT